MQQADLEKIISDHEKWFKDHAVGAKLILKDGVFAEVSFKGRILHQSEFTQVKFQKCDFTGTQMYRLKMESCTFEECLLDQAELDDSVINGLTITGTSMEKSSFDGCIVKSMECRKNSIKSSTWIKSALTDMIMEDCDLSSSSFRRAYLKGCKLSRCTLTECDLIRSKIVDSEFVNVNVSKSLFDESSLDGFKFHGLEGMPASQKATEFKRIFYSDPTSGALHPKAKPWT